MASRTSGGLQVGVLKDIIGFHIARAAVATESAFEAHLGGPFDLRKVEFSLLMIILANGEVSPKPLARALAVSAPKLTPLLDGLAQRGLIERRPHPQDGRSQLVVLTERGRQLSHSAERAARPMEAALSAKLSVAEHAMLIELLDKMAAQGER